MANILKGLKRFKRKEIPVFNGWIDDPVLGKGLDAQQLKGTGHISCPHDNSPFWYVNVRVPEKKLECYCATCGYELPIILPSTIKFEIGETSGKFECARHPNSHVCIIFQDGVLSVGCRNCNNEMRFTMNEEPLIYVPQ